MFEFFGDLKTCENGGKAFPYTLYREQKQEVIIIPPKIPGKNSAIGSVPRHWIQGTKCRLEQLMTLRGL